MRRLQACFTSDGRNRNGDYMPLSVLVAGLEQQLGFARAAGLPPGTPNYIAHDHCRPIGWASAHGVFIARDCARMLGEMIWPTDALERQNLQSAIEAFTRARMAREVEGFAEALIERTKGQASDAASFWAVEAASIVDEGIAARLFPAFFDPESPLVDKDGLVDYRALLARTRLIQPGVFHEAKSDLLIFAHRFFRRSLAHPNSLNGYALTSFHDAATSSERVTGRLRLDPDLVGHPDSEGAVVELEYWRGPPYSDDIATIASGVAEHKARASERLYAGIDRTQIWWKPPEPRRGGLASHHVRTFEIEELVEEPCPGLDDDAYGCRYAHAEYHLETGMISHFDGAIRAYPGDAYMERIGAAIDRAGKRSDYSKIFRLDGALPVPTWKRLLTDFYRGNRLVPEYLGASPEDLAPPDAASLADDASAAGVQADTAEGELPALSVHIDIGLTDRSPPTARTVLADRSIRADDETISFAEAGPARIRAFLRQWAKSPPARWGRVVGPVTNVSTLRLPGGATSRDAWRRLAAGLAPLIAAEADAGRLDQISLAVQWVLDDQLISVSIAGDAGAVAALLGEAVELVRPDQPASDWCEPLRDALLRHAPALTAPVAWPRECIDSGRLRLTRAERVEVELFGPNGATIAPGAHADAATPSCGETAIGPAAD